VNSPVLQVKDISVSFGGVVALKGVSLELFSGEVVGLIGPNGAGKTTLLDVISGYTRPFSGSVWMREEDISSVPVWRRARVGLTRTFQGVELFEDLTARENIEAAGLGAEETDELLDRLGLADIQHALAVEIPAGLKRLVGLGRALAVNPEVLLLDEPGAGLLPDEIETLAGIIRSVCDDLGISVLLVDHDMSLISLTCSRIEVLDFGRTIASGTPDEIRAHPGVLEAYLGV